MPFPYEQDGFIIEESTTGSGTGNYESFLRVQAVGEEEAAALVDSYEDAQLRDLKLALLAAGFIIVASLAATRHLPDRRFDELGGPAEATATA